MKMIEKSLFLNFQVLKKVVQLKIKVSIVLKNQINKLLKNKDYLIQQQNLVINGPSFKGPGEILEMNLI